MLCGGFGWERRGDVSNAAAGGRFCLRRIGFRETSGLGVPRTISRARRDDLGAVSRGGGVGGRGVAWLGFWRNIGYYLLIRVTEA